MALVAGTDYNTNTANTIAGLSALSANDQVEIVVYDTFSVFSGDVDSNMSVGGNLSVTGTSTLTGNVTASGTASIAGHASIGVDAVNSARALTVAGATDGSSSSILTLFNSSLASKFSVRDDGFVSVAGNMQITTADNTTQLTLISTDADNDIGPQLDLRRDSGSPADSDVLGRVRWLTDDDAGNLVESAILQSNLEDASQGTVDTQLQITTSVASTMRNRMKITSSEVVFNEDSIDSDFRVEGNGNVNALVVHGADDFIGIGLGTPKKRLHIQDTSTDGMIILDRADTSADHQICFAHNYGNSNQSGGNYYAIGVDDSENDLVIAFDANAQASLSSDAKLIVDSDGDLGIGTAPGNIRFKISNTENKITQFISSSNGSYSDNILEMETARGQSDVFNHVLIRTNNGGDTEFKIRGDGQVTADGAFTGGGADYAEYFEWADGNGSSEDRRGYSVVLDGNKVRKATSDDAAASIIGIVSAHPAVVGDSRWNKWHGKHEMDDYGTVVTETCSFVTWTERPADANGVAGEGRPIEHAYYTDRVPDGITVPNDAVVTSNQTRPKESSSFDPSVTYVPREERKEWDAVGMMGKLRMRKGQPTGDRWIKLRDISSNVEEWLVR